MTFTRTNYIIMIAGFLTMCLGYVIMGNDNEPYGFGTNGITLGPMIVLSGLLIEIVAILYKGKK
jgi:hypothetical protein